MHYFVDVAFKFDNCVVCPFIKPNKVVEVEFKLLINWLALIIIFMCQENKCKRGTTVNTGSWWSLCLVRRKRRTCAISDPARVLHRAWTTCPRYTSLRNGEKETRQRNLQSGFHIVHGLHVPSATVSSSADLGGRSLMLHCHALAFFFTALEAHQARDVSPTPSPASTWLS
jgi:hypothetical protein